MSSPENPTRPDAILWQGPYFGAITGKDIERMSDELTKRNVFFHRAFPYSRKDGARYLIIEGWKREPAYVPDVPSDEYLDALIFGETTHARENGAGPEQSH